MGKTIIKLLYGCIVFLLLVELLIFYRYLNWSGVIKSQSFSQDSSAQLTNSRVQSPAPIDVPKLNLNRIFGADNFRINQLPTENMITIITTGDVIPARTVNFKMGQYGNFRYPLEKTAEFLRESDITLINLESPLIPDCPTTNSGMIFCGNKQFVEGLMYADIDVVNLANNHSLNYGNEGLNQTVDLLNANGILVSGTFDHNLAIKQFNNSSIGFLGWNLLDQFDQAILLDNIRQAKTQVDILIVSLHWGAEYTAYPAAWQRQLAKAMIDSGADLIVGNHPHWIQPLEIYKDKLIIYAHGNFIFDQEWSQETKLGVVGKHIFYNHELVDSQFYPIRISDYSQPSFLYGDEKEKVLSGLRDASMAILKSPALN